MRILVHLIKMLEKVVGVILAIGSRRKERSTLFWGVGPFCVIPKKRGNWILVASLVPKSISLLRNGITYLDMALEIF